MFRHYFFFLFYLLLQFAGSAQTRTIDSLRQEVYLAKTDRNKLTSLLALCEEQLSMRADSLQHYAEEAKTLALALHDTLAVKEATYQYATSLWRQNNNDSAMQLIERELPENAITSATTRAMNFKLRILGIRLYTTNGMLKEATSAIYQLLTDAEKYNDTLNRIIAYTSVGVLKLRSSPNAKEALDWFLKSANVSNNPYHYRHYGVVYSNLARAYNKLGMRDSAEYYIQKAIATSRASEHLTYLSSALLVQADLYTRYNKWKEAEAALLENLTLRKKLHEEEKYSDDYQQLANFYANTGQYQKGIAVALDGLSKDTMPEQMIKYYQPLAKCYQLSGDRDNYEKILQASIDARDDFYEEDLAKTSEELQTKYEVQKKENTIIQQKLDLIKKNNLLYGSMGLLFFIGIIAFLLFNNYKKRQQMKLDRLQEEEKRLSKEAIKEAEEKERKRIAADLHDNLGAYAASVVSNLEFIKQDQLDDQSNTAMRELRNNSQSMVAQLSDTIWVLKKDALSLTGISDRVKVFIRRIQPSYPTIKIEVQEQLEQDPVLLSSQAYHLFLIIQEAVNNALRHSRCRNVYIKLESDGSSKITITDDGTGITENKSSHYEGNGLANMKSRAQQAGWNIYWQPNSPQGTIVILEG